jgi:5-methylcytosine-specific restriction enzyme subunit McrC
MLLVTEGIEDALQNDIEETAALSFGEGKGPWVHLLAAPFLKRLREIEKESLAPGRKEREAWLPYVKGRINTVPTLKAIAQGKSRPVSCRYRERTYATPENRVLGAAARRLMRLREVPSRQDRQLAARWIDLMQEKRLKTSELRRVVAGLSTGRYTGYRQYYIPALTMARLILSQASVSFRLEGAIETESLLTNMPLLFERYVRKVLALELSSKGYVVKKARGASQTRRLFTDGTCEMEHILVSSSSGVRLVADAKYKPGSDTAPSDYYQLTSYLDAYECQTGMLIIAEEENSRAGEVVKRRVHRRDQEVYEVRLPLGNAQAAEEKLLETTSRVVS